MDLHSSKPDPVSTIEEKKVQGFGNKETDVQVWCGSSGGVFPNELSRRGACTVLLPGGNLVLAMEDDNGGDGE